MSIVATSDRSQNTQNYDKKFQKFKSDSKVCTIYINPKQSDAAPCIIRPNIPKRVNNSIHEAKYI